MISAGKPITHIVQQHAEEAAILHNIRSAQVMAPHIKLHHLRRIDDRIAAHLDGLAVAGEYGLRVCDTALESPGIGEIFVSTVQAIENKDGQRLEKLLALVNAVPAAQPGLISALDWVSAQFLQGVGVTLLTAMDSCRQQAGISACIAHRIDPGAILGRLVTHAEPQLRARALRAAGELGRRDLRSVCEQYLMDQDVTCCFWAAWSAILLGNRASAISVLKEYSLMANPFQEQALELILKVLPLTDTHLLLKTLAQDTAGMRYLVRGAGVAGDPYYIPWLIRQMDNPKFSRLAGESFSLMTGLDLAYLDLEREAPKDIESGPNDDPADENVAMDEDDDLPWPDPVKIQYWWDTNSARFPNGERYFMGGRITHEHCVKVLKEGYQRQRTAAAQYLCLLNPGNSIFPVSAPAWRQQRWLNQMN